MLKKYNKTVEPVPSHVKAFIFDLDNTLFPTKSFVKRARAHAVLCMIEAGLCTSEKKALSMLEKIILDMGSNCESHFDVLVERINGKKDPKIIAAGIVGYHKTKEAIIPFPDVKKTLIALKRHHALFVASQGVELKQWDKLVRMDLHHFFDAVFVTKNKDVAFYRRVAKELRKRGIKPEEAVMIGDTYEKDIAPARLAGFRALLLGKDINKISELLK